ncbi:Intersectin-1 [Araneus ventricosus]|uniref:Intersectin-1 n=1 Tax=Araneus ventricosus TaxID=182803 RepID=A0A4Y2K800_ARAVE|nr:Intersectin-1 [Araneus ventricosus]
MFNSYDRTRTGFLTGAQARNILVNTGLSQPILAQIWTLADIDSDGRLSCEEFVLALHLAESVKAGDALPSFLPPELIPPSHRRKRSTSIQSTGSTSSHALGDINLLGDFKDEKTLQQQTTFEDKRRENFEKGQAELEKRRLALLEAQRKEQEERERKEREEHERRERIRQEQERRRQLELEKQLAKQRELEQEKEEQRRKALEQREAARREMERQRQLEWEKQRRQELISQRQKEQEAVCHLKNLNKNLTFELEQLSKKINEINETISATRKNVTDVKTSIDNMRTERDAKLEEMNNVKAKIKEMNDRLLILSQEKISMRAQLSSVPQTNPSIEYSTVLHSFDSKKAALEQLKSTVSIIEDETAQKQKDIENNNSQIQKSLTGAGDAENATAVTKWISDDQKAKADIILSIHPSELSQIKNCKTSHELWTKLKNIYESKVPARKATLLKQLLFTKMTYSKNRNEHINKFFMLVDKLKEMEIEIANDLLAILLLYSIPESYENFRIAIESRDELPSPETLKIKLIEEANARKNKEIPTFHDSQRALYTEKKKQKQQ